MAGAAQFDPEIEAVMEQVAFNLADEFGADFVLGHRDFAVAAHKEFASALSQRAKLEAAYAPDDAREARVRVSATRNVLAERLRQIEVEGWTAEHDDKHERGEMALAASCYAMNAAIASKFDGEFPTVAQLEAAHSRSAPPPGWPWHNNWWKPKDRRSALVRAAALLIAEIERLDRLSTRETA